MNNSVSNHPLTLAMTEYTETFRVKSDKSKSKSTALQAQYLPRRGTQCAN